MRIRPTFGWMIAALAVALMATRSSADDMITVTIDFEYINFPKGSGFDTVSGSVSFSFDRTVSIFNQPVDGIIFELPSLVFPLAPVRFDYKQGMDTEIASNDHEFEIYFEEMPVSTVHPDDFLIRTGGIGPLNPGTSHTTGMGGPFQVASLFLYGGSNHFPNFPASSDDFITVTIDSSLLLGDVNLDCEVNLLDVNDFVDRLATGTYQDEADCNQDGVVNLLDVDSFISILGGG